MVYAKVNEVCFLYKKPQKYLFWCCTSLENITKRLRIINFRFQTYNCNVCLLVIHTYTAYESYTVN